MRSISINLRTMLAVATALALGYAARWLELAPPTVHAQSRGSQSHPTPDSSLEFQLSGIGPTTALTVYNAAERTLYVYPAVTQGTTHVNCSFMLHMNRPGSAIERQNCAPGSAE